ncbi:MAG: Co2+/Mg2+ efflux protein ApaG, partial [Flavobacteriales bacterium]
PTNMMITKSTAGINVSVEIQYNARQSHPIASHYFFAYSITIKNVSDYTVQLKKRHWFIFDSNGIKSEVEGDGVVGEQPILIPGQSYQYVSGCNLLSDMGKMGGVYIMEREIDGEVFHVTIPEFMMVVPYKFN